MKNQTRLTRSGRPVWSGAPSSGVAMYKRILVPLDGSELAESALPHAAALARGLESQIRLVRVNIADEFVYGPAGQVAPYADEVLERDRQEAVAYLGRIRARLQHPGLAVITEVLKGPVAQAIIEYAAAQQIDLIVMSTHGRSGLNRLIFGSVAEKVLQGARCPTLIVRGPSA